MAELVERLVAIQAAHGWTDEEMAEKAGLSRPMYSAVKTRRARLGHRSLKPILRNFPELRDEVIAYMLAGAPSRGESLFGEDEVAASA